MAESSIGWTTNATGDGLVGGYTMAQFINWVQLLTVDDGDEDDQAVVYGQGNGLAVTVTGAHTCSVNTGAAVVYGFPYWNTAAVAVTLTTPIVGVTGWRIVLRASWAAQTVRITKIESADGVAAIPALTQVDATTWDIPLAQGTIALTDVVTIASDDRKYLGQRTRTLFVPCTSAYNNTDATRIQRATLDARGYPLADNKECVAFGDFLVPSDFADTATGLSCTPIVIPEATGNVRHTWSVSWGAATEDWDAFGVSAAGVDTAVTDDKISLLPALVATNVSVGDYVIIEFVRNGTHANDTIGQEVDFRGWNVTYTALPTRP